VATLFCDYMPPANTARGTMPASAMYLYGRLAKIQKAGLGGDPSGAKGAEGPTDLKAVVAAARMASEEEAAAIAALEPHNPARDVLDDTRGWRQKARAMMRAASPSWLFDTGGGARLVGRVTHDGSVRRAFRCHGFGLCVCQDFACLVRKAFACPSLSTSCLRASRNQSCCQPVVNQHLPTTFP
jgi:hypothetical protein